VVVSIGQAIESKRSEQKQQLDKKQQELELKKAEMKHEAKLKREAKECQVSVVD
jgi:hypothetical protein